MSPQPKCSSVIVGLVALCVVALCVMATPASATWSVIATDGETGEVGGAVAACVDASALSDVNEPQFVFALVPGIGIGIVTGQVNPTAVNRMEEMIRVGDTAEDILEVLTAEEVDDQADARQFAIARVGGDVAAFTGANTVEVSADRQGDRVSFQGDSLASAETVDDMAAAWDANGDLAFDERVLAALVAGAEAGGDVRCGDQTALFAQVVVAERTDTAEAPSVLATQVEFRDGVNPVTGLAQTFATGERRFATLPEAEGRGWVVNIIGAVAAVVAVGSGIWFWRYAYRKPRY